MLSDIISRVEQVIGKNEKNDKELKPKTHAGSLPEEAGALKRILEEKDPIPEIIENYEKNSDKAEVQQLAYKRWGRLEIQLALAATIVGAFFLLPIPWKGASDYVKWAAVLMQFMIICCVFLVSLWLAWRKPFEKWMLYRGEAEIARGALFDEVMAAEEPIRDNELPLLPLKLEYFRRYHLDVQRAFYRERSREHAEAAGRTDKWRYFKQSFTAVWALIAFCASMFLLTKVIGEENLPAFLQWFNVENLPANTEIYALVFGVVISAFYTQRVSESLMNMDLRNAARYRVVSKHLEELAGKELRTAQMAAVNGDKETVLKFVNDVQKLVSTEHKEWILLRPHITNKYLVKGRSELLEDNIESFLNP